MPAIPDDAVIDTIGPTGHRDDNTIGRSRCSRIEIGRTVIVEEDAVRPPRVMAMMIVVHARGE